jgi:hypothetical protein
MFSPRTLYFIHELLLFTFYNSGILFQLQIFPPHLEKRNLAFLKDYVIIFLFYPTKFLPKQVENYKICVELVTVISGKFDNTFMNG